MNNIYNTNLKLINNDLLTKFNYTSIFELYNFKSIKLVLKFHQNLSNTGFNTKDLLKGLLLLKLLTKQKVALYCIKTLIKNKFKLVGFKCKVTLSKLQRYEFFNLLLYNFKNITNIKQLNINSLYTKNDLIYICVKDITFFLSYLPLQFFFMWQFPLHIYIQMSKKVKKKKIPSGGYLYNLYNINKIK